MAAMASPTGLHKMTALPYAVDGMGKRPSELIDIDPGTAAGGFDDKSVAAYYDHSIDAGNFQQIIHYFGRIPRFQFHVCTPSLNL
jgi:hypothetical protein